MKIDIVINGDEAREVSAEAWRIKRGVSKLPEDLKSLIVKIDKEVGKEEVVKYIRG